MANVLHAYRGSKLGTLCSPQQALSPLVPKFLNVHFETCIVQVSKPVLYREKQMCVSKIYTVGKIETLG